VVEGGQQADLAREQHPVAEYVAGHVADTDDGERLLLDVGAEFSEMALDRLPGAARGDSDRLVVVALRAAGRERIPEPEAVLRGDAVGDV
jgi:hypothetical protein